ncbi:PREDICTED: afadin-like, partial [Rhagoletis zephyria]|uniref:afadin-like n=1 Tax=Rhagoletis zephyria TaxID=28612 RepID=UPI000811AA7A
DLEFYGVMRFYFQDAGQKVATKCLRISSSASTHDVIANLIEKFRPDIRMLSVPEYALYEIHENGEERKLAESEMPLLVQLNWHKDDREGRFLLRRMDEKTNLSGISNTETSGNLLNRKLSKREKKEKKKREKKEKAAKGSDKGGKDSLAEKLYTELPETSFTRSISNPEAVMRRRRQQKLEKKLQQFSAEGGPEAGGTLRIFGESINQDVPYKTILLSTQDTAAFAVKEILEKYGKDKEEPANYCLVQIIVPYANGTSYILDDDDCPLIIERSHLKSRGVLTFHIRRRPPDFQPRKRKKKSPGSSFDGNSSVASDLGAGIITKQQQQQQPVHGEETATSALLNGGAKLMPYIVEVNADGSELTLGRSSNIPGTTGPRRHFLFMNVTESSLDAQQQQQQQQLMPPPSGTPTSMMMQLRSAQAAGQQQTGPAGSNTMRKPGAGGGDNILPAILEVWEEIEPLFLNLLITRADPNAIQFKLAITYTLYMVTRFRASTYFKPEIVPNQRATLLIGFCIRYAKLIHKEIGERQRAQAHLAFWLANSSELLHFLKNDRHLAAFTLESQEILADAVQYAFGGLVRCQQAELKEALAAFPDDQRSPGNSNSNTSSTTSTSTARVLAVLSNSMALLRRFRVNAALTIQLFSQLFHYINMWLFNRVLGTAESNLCSRPYGDRLKAALLEIEAWAEKQGLELAAECHLSRIAQTAQFLQAPKAGRSAEELTALVDKFYKLNSLQLRALFERYQPTGAEELANAAFVRLLRDPALIEAVVKQARVATDELILKEGREVRLEEEIDLQLPFLLPEDGYSCDIVVGIPATLADFVQSLVAARVAKLTVQPTASGYWTIYFINFAAMFNSFNGMRTMPEPEVQIIKLQKINNGIGLSIVAAQGTHQPVQGIYIKSVVKDGAADLDGRLKAGDQLLKVDGHSLIGIDQENAAKLMTNTGPVVTLEVAKQGAVFHGLSGLLKEQSASTTSLLKQGNGLCG